MLNATILNGMGVVGNISSPPVFEPDMGSENVINMDFEYSEVLWPWSGYLAIYIRVNSAEENYEGLVSGKITFTVESPAARQELQERSSTVILPFVAEVIPTPPRKQRILWDQYHSIKYPPAYFPRDNLEKKHDILDWNGDHPHTNYHGVYNSLREQGYFLEVLGSPYTCFDASQYGVLLLVDPEDEFHPEEIQKLNEDIEKRGVGLVVFAEWYNVDSMKKMKFFDDNTRSWWIPATGGANVPALNDLLEHFGIAFGDAVVQGKIEIGRRSFRYTSGANIAKFPKGGYLHAFDLSDRSGGREHDTRRIEILGLTDAGNGHIAVYGDSGCLDSSAQQDDDCHDLLGSMIEYAAGGLDSTMLLNPESQLDSPFGDSVLLPSRFNEVNFTEVSYVLQHPLTCYLNSPSEVHFLEEMENFYPPNYGTDRTSGGAVDGMNGGTDGEGSSPEYGIRGGEETENLPKPTEKGDQLTQSQPPIYVTKWSLIVGIIVLVGLYKVTRRRRTSNNLRESNDENGEHNL